MTTIGVKTNEKTLHKQISDLLHELGMPAHIAGHDYFRSAIEKTYYDASYRKNVMKRLYPEIADKYNASPSAVQKAMSEAIAIAWLRGSSKVLYSVFGNSVDNLRAQPGTKEFVLMIVDYLKNCNM